MKISFRLSSCMNGLREIVIFMISLILASSISSWGGIKTTLSIEKNKYLLDEAIFYEVEMQAQGKTTSYFQWVSHVPSLEIKDINDHTIPTSTLIPEYAYPLQPIMGKRGKGIIQAEKIVPGESYYIISGSPISLSRDKFKSGQYKARFPIQEYDQNNDKFKFSYSDWLRFEIVEPSENEAQIDSLLLSVLPLIKQIQYTMASKKLEEIYKRYPESIYAGTIMWKLSALLPRNQADEGVLKYFEKHPNSVAASYGVWLLIVDWSNNDYNLLSKGKEIRNKIDSLATKYKGTRIEEAIRKQLAMLERSEREK